LKLRNSVEVHPFTKCINDGFGLGTTLSTEFRNATVVASGGQEEAFLLVFELSCRSRRRRAAVPLGSVVFVSGFAREPFPSLFGGWVGLESAIGSAALAGMVCSLPFIRNILSFGWCIAVCVQVSMSGFGFRCLVRDLPFRLCFFPPVSLFGGVR
jgi:hypothetical protein